MDREQLEHENQRLADQLSNKVSHLKSLAYDMELETKEHNRLLGGLSWDFEGSHGLLSSSMGRVHKMVGAAKGNRRLACYAALLVVALVLLGYALATRR
ncbi:BET1-like protein [Ixodes scapularis]|uniref:BET1-like protein n=1 Tax=Ixodes scapularis TaxID=6945 RepID=UPI0011252829|nr:BET1-like protein [Ixodes scapularis]XP_029846413.1 BET1-like protein [Ixodes scapularis]